MSPWEPFSAYFEASLTAFHDHLFQSLSWLVVLVGSDNFQFLVVVICSRYHHTSFQVFAISI
jgi:hypothetical protein